MSGRRPLIIATLPARDAGGAWREAELARSLGADIGEIRLDRWDAGARPDASALFPSPLPLLAALRSRSEGGEGPDSSDERSPLLRSAARAGFAWIDLEHDRDLALLADLPPPSELGRVISSHLPEDASTAEVARRLRGTPEEAAVRKVVLPASVGRLVNELLPALPPRDEGRRVLHTTGASGALLRAWAGRLDFPFVYAALPETTGGPRPVEPSQIPIDRLRPFLDGATDAPIFGVTGHPVAHSRSPALHTRWMRAAGRPGLYLAFDVASETEFVEAIPILARGGFRGLNITHPWKGVALASASRVERSAEVCGVANCLTLRATETEADNTDLAAILRRLAEYRDGGFWAGDELVVAGAGGAASATLAAARELGAEAFVVARRVAEAETVASRFGAHALGPTDLRPFPLVVHATPVGRTGAGALDLPLAPLLDSGTRLLDWVYAADEPSVSAIAEQAGATYEDGWRLLVYQAAASYGIWWGEEPDRAEIESAISGGPCAG